MEINKESHPEFFALLDAIGDTINEISRLSKIIVVAKRGIYMNTQAVHAFEVMKSISKRYEEYTDEKYTDERAEELKISSEIANSEMSKGFPFLNSQATILMYTHLEAGIKRFITTYFKHYPLFDIKEVTKIKISIGEYMSLDENERLDYLFQEFEESIGSGTKYGLTRFEKLLSPINYSGAVDGSVSKDIFELSQIRNVLLHRGGIADWFFIKSCPWLEYKVGDHVKVTNESVTKYVDAVAKYIMVLMRRLYVKFGVDTSDLDMDEIPEDDSTANNEQ